MHARDLVHLAERIYVITMPDKAEGSSPYRINDEETFVEQIAQHASFKGYERSIASGVYILTFEADTPEQEQMQWISQILAGTDLSNGRGEVIKGQH
jgi:hypothetical protein